MSTGFRIMWLTVVMTKSVNGSARKSIYKQSIAAFGRMGQPPILLILRFSVIRTRRMVTPSAILPM